MKKFTKTASATAIMTLAALFSVAGNATVIDSGSNNPLAFNWSFDTGTDLLTGNGTLTVSGFNTNLLTVGVTLNNTSLNLGMGGDRLTAFGFGIDPNATSVSFSDASDGGMIDASLDNIPSLALIEVCAEGGQNCAGGGNGGIFAGTSDTFSIFLGGVWGNSVDIAPIGFKYQTGNGSFEFTTSSSGGQTSGSTSSTSTSTSTGGQTSGSTSGTTVPEPGMLALLGIGFLGQALLLRQRRQRVQ